MIMLQRLCVSSLFLLSATAQTTTWSPLWTVARPTLAPNGGSQETETLEDKARKQAEVEQKKKDDIPDIFQGMFESGGLLNTASITSTELPSSTASGKTTSTSAQGSKDMAADPSAPTMPENDPNSVPTIPDKWPGKPTTTANPTTTQAVETLPVEPFAIENEVLSTTTTTLAPATSTKPAEMTTSQAPASTSKAATTTTSPTTTTTSPTTTTTSPTTTTSKTTTSPTTTTTSPTTTTTSPTTTTTSPTTTTTSPTTTTTSPTTTTTSPTTTTTKTVVDSTTGSAVEEAQVQSTSQPDDLPAEMMPAFPEQYQDTNNGKRGQVQYGTSNFDMWVPSSNWGQAQAMAEQKRWEMMQAAIQMRWEARKMQQEMRKAAKRGKSNWNGW